MVRTSYLLLCATLFCATLLCATCCGSEPEPTTVCLTELWEVYDYDYLSDEDTYGELVIWAWTVEVKSELANGMTGWTYAGFIRFSRIVWYGSDEDVTDAWWCTKSGTSGSEVTVENAVRQILEQNGPVGEIEMFRR